MSEFDKSTERKAELHALSLKKKPKDRYAAHDFRFGRCDAKASLVILAKALEELNTHEECEDGFFSCPKADGYFGPATECNCRVRVTSEAIAKIKERGDWPLEIAKAEFTNPQEQEIRSEG